MHRAAADRAGSARAVLTCCAAPAAAAGAPAGLHQRLRAAAGGEYRPGSTPRPRRGTRYRHATRTHAAAAAARRGLPGSGPSQLCLHPGSRRHYRRRGSRDRSAERHLRRGHAASRRRSAAGLGLLRLRPRGSGRGVPPAGGTPVRGARLGGADAASLVRALGGALPASGAALSATHGAVRGRRRRGDGVLAPAPAPANRDARTGVRHRGQPGGGGTSLPVRVPGVHSRHPGLEQVRQDQLRLLRRGRCRHAPRGGRLAALHLRKPGPGRAPALPVGGVPYHQLGRGGRLLLRRTGVAPLPLDRGSRLPGGAVPGCAALAGARAGGERPGRDRHHDRLLRVLAERRPLARRQVRGPRCPCLGRADGRRRHGPGPPARRGCRALRRVRGAGAAAAGAGALARRARRLRFGRVERRRASAAGDTGAVPAGPPGPGVAATPAARRPLSA